MSILKTVIRGSLRALGYTITREMRPIRYGRPGIIGSFPPPDEWSLVGRPQDWFMHDGYRHRESVSYCDATGSAEEWQREVYQFAREVFDLHGLGTVCDIGCGSGHKLLQHFGHASTVGVDVPATCAVLRKRWPARSWLDSFTVPPVSVDLVIAADVIEHLQDPDELLGYIQKLHPKWIVVSTPDRNLLREGTHDGPPHEPTHVREWSYAEFRAYIGSRFEIEAHFITWPAQATQCVLCRPRES